MTIKIQLGRRSGYTALISDLLVKEGLNRRVDYGDIEALATQIEAVGAVLEPIIGIKHPTEPGKLLVTDGHRRLKALKLLHNEGRCKDIVEVPFDYEKLDKRKGELKDFLITQVIRNSGKPLTAYEEAVVFQDMLSDCGMTQKDICGISGYSAAIVSERLSLLKVDGEVLAYAQDNGVAPSATVVAVRTAKGDSARTQEIIEEAVSQAQAEGKPVSRSHVKHAAEGVSRTEMLAFCVEFDDWDQLPSSKLRSIYAAFKKATAEAEAPAELPQTAAELDTALALV